MTEQTWRRMWMATVFMGGLFLGIMAMLAAGRFRAADTGAGLTIDGNTIVWRGVPEDLMVSCTTIPKRAAEAPRAPCYPVEALAPPVAHEFAQALHTSVEALMGVEKCP